MKLIDDSTLVLGIETSCDETAVALVMGLVVLLCAGAIGWQVMGAAPAIGADEEAETPSERTPAPGSRPRPRPGPGSAPSPSPSPSPDPEPTPKPKPGKGKGKGKGPK